MITIFELAQFNAMKKNKTRRVSQTHKDVEAFLMVNDYFEYVELCGYSNVLNAWSSYKSFWDGWLTDMQGNTYNYLEVTPNALEGFGIKESVN